jgi:hypothetical protein
VFDTVPHKAYLYEVKIGSKQPGSSHLRKSFSNCPLESPTIATLWWKRHSRKNLVAISEQNLLIVRTEHDDLDPRFVSDDDVLGDQFRSDFGGLRRNERCLLTDLSFCIWVLSRM